MKQFTRLLKMIIDKIELQQFRNYKQCEQNFSPNVNILYGLNGQGKTNLLEAIYLCTCARSHRTAKDEDLVFLGENFYKIDLFFENQKNYQENLSVQYEIKNELTKKAKRFIFHDGIQLSKISEMMGIFHAVIFAPEDLQLIKNAPAVRRRFLDLLLSQLDRVYFSDLQKFTHVLQQRNQILKQKENLDTVLLDVWDWQYAEFAAGIILKRINLCKKISQLASLYYKEISGQKEIFSFQYFSNALKKLDVVINEEDLCLQNELKKVDLQKHIFEKLCVSRNDDLIRGSSSIGPQRDDILFFMNGKQAKNIASQGQMRSMVLAMKLAELSWVKNETKENPVLLLDDVMSELDPYRRSALIDSIRFSQVFVTCTEAEQVEPFKKMQGNKEDLAYYKVENGEIKAFMV